MATKDALALKFRIGKIKELAEDLPSLVSHLLPVHRRVGTCGSLLRQALEPGKHGTYLRAQHIVSQVEPALGRIHIALVLLGGIDVIAGHKYAIGASRII